MKSLKGIFYRFWFLNLLQKSVFSKRTIEKYDISFLVCDDYGWILDGICDEIIARTNKSLKIKKTNRIDNLSSSHNYFLTHYTSLYPFFCFNNYAIKQNIFVLYTHDYEENKSERLRSIHCLNMCKKVFCMNKTSMKKLINEGVSEEILEVVYGGADPFMILTKKRKTRKIGIVSNASIRKNPHFISRVIESLPELEFKVVGKGWKEFLQHHKNVEFEKHEYRMIGSIYNDIDVFFSASHEEGGPIPLIESMFSNAVPVVSNTGFCPDLIIHGNNGYLFEKDSSIILVSDLIKKALSHNGNIRTSVEHLTWENFAHKIIKSFEYK